jgi:hypothetical protein
MQQDVTVENYTTFISNSQFSAKFNSEIMRFLENREV